MNVAKHSQKIKVIAKKAHHYSKGPFWFLVGFTIAGLTILSVVIIVFQHLYRDKTIPGVYVDSINVSGKTRTEIENLYDNKNKIIGNSKFSLTFENDAATVSAKQLNIGYDSKLIAEQAVNLGKSANFFGDIYIVINSYINGTTLHSSFTFDADKFAEIIKPLEVSAYEEPMDALFTIENNRVTAFRQSLNGKRLDTPKAKAYIDSKIPVIIKNEREQTFSYEIPTITIKPAVTTEEANSFGIVEEIGEGKSYFYHSIPNRIHNITLAASKVNGILVKPGEEFSFDKYLGDVSRLTGYKEAYVIQNGKTVLGDGGGVCQVSTTLFRALLNAGLPITERHAHAYRVGYYEEDSPPGLDATVFYPSVDLKFKNDTQSHILIQSYIDQDNLSLTYILYGKKDGREVNVTTPVITGYAPAPEPLYQDDPTLPKGLVNQVDFAASGATVIFNRTVKKDGKDVIDEKYVSRYAPWRAVFLRGTKEG